MVYYVSDYNQINLTWYSILFLGNLENLLYFSTRSCEAYLLTGYIISESYFEYKLCILANVVLSRIMQQTSIVYHWQLCRFLQKMLQSLLADSIIFKILLKFANGNANLREKICSTSRKVSV
jgi:hypothetical protein